MRILVQRASRASVSVDGEVLSSFEGSGLVLLVGATHDDTVEVAQAMARKVSTLRIMHDEKSVLDIGGGVLVISQFTLYADTRKGRRPSWLGAAPGPVAEPLVDAVAAELRAAGLSVGQGRFGADMAVELVNDGPMTVFLES